VETSPPLGFGIRLRPEAPEEPFHQLLRLGAGGTSVTIAREDLATVPVLAVSPDGHKVLVALRSDHSAAGHDTRLLCWVRRRDFEDGKSFRRLQAGAPCLRVPQTWPYYRELPDYVGAVLLD
jgi:hypothetical protein